MKSGEFSHVRPRRLKALPKPVLVTTPPEMSSKLRSSSTTTKQQFISSTTEFSPTNSDGPVRGHFDDYDLLANLRTDERDQEMMLDLKPPPLPKKLIQNQGLWELKLKEPKDLRHNNEHIQALKQVTNRLMAKAKEMVIVMEGDDAACEKQLEEAHELCVDTIAMFEGSIDRKKYRRKWMAKRAAWAKEYDLDGRSI